MSLSKSVTRIVAAAAALALVAPACGTTGKKDIEEAAPPPIEEATKHPTDSFASAELRKGTEEMQELAHTIATAIDEHKLLDGDTASKAAEMLDGFDFTLRSHVILTSLLTHAVLYGKPEDVEAAGHTVEENSTTLVHHLLGTHYDRKTLEDFEVLWKSHITRVVDYAQAARAKDAATQGRNRDELRVFAQKLGVFISRDLTHGGLDAALVTDELTKLVESMLAVVDAQARGPDWHLNLEPGLERATAFAETFAGGVARQAAVQGSIETQAALLLTELTGLLADHVYFTGLMTQPILLDQREAAASASELVKTNTDKLAEFFGTNFGEETARRFRSLWEHQVAMFEEYARKLRAQEAEGVQHAKDELATFAKHFGELVANRVEHKVEARSVEQRTNLYIETLIEAVRSQARAAGH